MKKHLIGLSTKVVREDIFTCRLFDCLEYSQSHLVADSMENVKRDVPRFIELAREYNVDLRSFHIPFASTEYYRFEPANLDPAVREMTWNNTLPLLDLVIPMGIRYVVLHGGVHKEDVAEKPQLDVFCEYTCRLCDYLKPYGITVAVETLRPQRIGHGLAHHQYMASQIDRDNYGICFDSNHFLGNDYLTFLEAIGDRVVTTHLSDFDGTPECHWFPGRGIIDWKRVVELLDEKGYDGPCVFEVEFPNKIASAQQCRDLVSGWNKALI